MWENLHSIDRKMCDVTTSEGFALYNNKNIVQSQDNDLEMCSENCTFDKSGALFLMSTTIQLRSRPLFERLNFECIESTFARLYMTLISS